MSPRDNAPRTQSLEMAKRAFARSAYLPPKSPDIKTKAELQRRIAARAKPLPVLELNPVSHRVTAMKQRTDQQNEKRIAALKQRLGAARQKTTNDHKSALAKGKSKADFNRTRDQRSR